MITGLNLLRRNVISNAIGIVIPALSWIVVVPTLVSQLGVDGFGVYTLAISIAGFMSFLELGLTSAAVKFIADVEIQKNSEQLEKIVSSNISLYVVVGVLVATLSFLFAPFIASLIFKDTQVKPNDLSLIVKLSGVLLSLTLIKNALSSVLMGFQRYDIYNLIQVNYAIIQSIALVAVGIIWKDIAFLMVTNIAVLILSIAGFKIAIYQLSPNLQLLRTPDYYCLKVMFAFGLYMMLINFSSNALMNMDKVIIGTIMGPESVSYYSVPTQIALKIHNGLAVLMMFIFPLTSEIHSTKDEKTIRILYIESMRYIMFVYGLIMVFLATFSHDILQVWIGQNFADASATVLVITSIAYLPFGLTIAPYHMLLGLGRPKELSFLCLINSICVIAFLYVGVQNFKLIGGCFGVLFGMVTMFSLPWYAQKILKVSWGIAFNAIYGRTLICCITGIVLSTLVPEKIMYKLAFYFIFVIAVSVLGNTTKDDFYRIKKAMSKVTIAA